MIKISDYPELKLISWSFPDLELIEDQKAFGLYEANWRHVDQSLLQPHEKALIERLKNEYGKGVMNV